MHESEPLLTSQKEKSKGQDPHETPTIKEEKEADMTSEDVRKQQEMEKLSDQYTCLYDGSKGNLFAGTESIVFVGWVYFFEKRVEIKWVNVMQVIMGNSIEGGSVICFIMNEPNTEYEFSDFQDVETVWATLVSLHSKAMAGRAPVKQPSNRLLDQHPRRMSLVPIMESSEVLEEASTGVEASYVSRSQSSYISRSIIVDNLAASSVARRQSLMSSIGTVKLEDVEFEADPADLWRELKEGGETKCTYETTAIRDLVLSCSLDDFFDKFVSNKATFSFKDFMESSGESNVIVPEWKLDENEVFSRSVEYTHPVNAPMAPPMARARKQQRYRRYGQAGISIETDTYVEDVPMADCFYVTERILIERKEDSKGEVVVLVQFDIRFVKSTMFRSIIASTTQSECLKGLQQLGKYWEASLITPITPEEPAFPEELALAEEPPVRRLSSVLGGRNMSSRTDTRRRSTAFETILVEEPKKEEETNAPWSSTNAVLLLLVCVLILQVWLVVDGMGTKKAMLELQSSVSDLKTAVASLGGEKLKN